MLPGWLNPSQQSIVVATQDNNTKEKESYAWYHPGGSADGTYSVALRSLSLMFADVSLMIRPCKLRRI